MEAMLFGTFLASACVFGALYEFPNSPVRQAITSGLARRLLMGASMGLMVILLIYSPWGKQSGAHINPAVTLTFFRLGKVKFWDALFYIVAQIVGATLAVLLVALVLGWAVAEPAVRYLVTLPDKEGAWPALFAEFAIALAMMSLVLSISNHHRFDRYTGVLAGMLVAVYISIEAPFSPMGMHLVRAMSSLLSTMTLTGVVIYLTVPPTGMLTAAELYLWRHGAGAVKCCKLHHNNDKRCIFCGANGGWASQD
jgi:aquaporin Z